MVWRHLDPDVVTLREPLPIGERPVLLVTCDTTRADHLEPWGAEDVATPNLVRLASQGIVFEQAFSVAPITLPAHTSILTGLYPFEHGVRNNGLQSVPAEVTTLAERLAERGYRTGAFVSAAVLEKRYGLDQGFEIYDDDLSTGRDRMRRAVADRPAEAAVDSAHAWLDTVGEDERFFLWTHFYDPHAPYSPPAPYRDDYRERLYDGEIAYMDEQLGRLFEHPRIAGAKPELDPIVLFIGDHGESLGEHGERTHALLAYDATLHVPWILRVPGGPKDVRIPTPVSQTDLVPTVLELLGLESDTALAGESLVGRVEGRAPAAGEDPEPAHYSETYLPYYTYGWAKIRALRRGFWKYIDAPEPELYNLRKDPRELTNIHDGQPGQAHDLRRDLEEMLARVDDPEAEASISLDAEAAEKLRSLGYLAVGSGTSRDDAERPDPKSMVDLHVGLERGRALLEDRLWGEAAQQFRKVLQRDPDNLAALIDLASTFEGQRDYDQAVVTIERGLELDPDYLQLYLMLARLETLREDHQRALDVVELALEKSPSSPEALMQQAALLTRLGRAAEGKSVLDEAVAAMPEHPHLNLAYARSVEIPSGQVEAAEERLTKVVERDPFLAGGWRLLGQVYERTGRPQEAVDSYREGLERQSDDVELHAALGHVLARRGERDEAEQHLREAIRLSATFRAELHVSLGGVLAEAGRYEDAQKAYDKVLAVEPEHPGARNNAAIALYRSGQADAAWAELQKLVAEYPRHSDAHNNLAAIAVDRQEWRAAEFHSRKALDLDDTIVQAWNNLAIAREQQGDLGEARRGYERALALDPDYWPAHFNLGILLQKQGEMAAAAASFSEVLARHPRQAQAHMALGEIYSGELADPERARNHWNAFLRYAPNHPQAAEVRRRIEELPPS